MNSKTFSISALRPNRSDPGIDLICYYADFGLPYRDAIERLVATAREVMPEMNLVLLSPNAAAWCIDLFDEHHVTPNMPTVDTLMLERLRAHISWFIGTTRRTVVVDVDIAFRHPVVFDGSFDVGLTWRDNRPDQPMNAGLILVEPGQRAIWSHYANVAVNLPSMLHRWWVDQMAFCLLLGVCHKAGEVLSVDGARVALMDSRHVSDVPERIMEDAWTVHHKGPRKGGMFRELYQKSAAGMLLRDSA